MIPAKSRSDFVTSLYSGIALKGVLKWPILPVFIALSASLFLIVYVGLYSLLNLGITNQFVRGYTNVYPYYVVPSSLALVALAFFLYFYLLSLTLEIKGMLDSKVHRGMFTMMVATLYKYPKFLVASVFQLFVFIGGLILFVIPGFYLGTKTLFFSVASYSGDFTLYGALKESNFTVSGSFLKCLYLLIAYFAIFVALVYTISFADLSAMWDILFISVIVSFVSISFLSSSDTLYYIIKSQSMYRRSPLIRQFLGNPI